MPQAKHVVVSGASMLHNSCTHTYVKMVSREHICFPRRCPHLKKRKKSKGEDSPKLKRIYQEPGPMAKEEELCVLI